MKKSGFDLRREKKMRNIEEVTIKLLNEKDISNITMEEIAKNAQASKVTLFNYYNTKDNLINTAVRNFFASMYEEYEQLVESNLSFEQTYLEITQSKMKKVHSTTPMFVHNVMQQYASDPTFYDKETQETSDQLLLSLLQKGRKEGKINPAYSDEVLMMYMHIFTEGLKSQANHSDQIMKYGDQISQMFLNGLR